ncbi:MAG: hypothetical protein AAFN74_14835 [Myxococcota bacterium]
MSENDSPPTTEPGALAASVGRTERFELVLSPIASRFPWVLVLVSVILAGWGVLGLVEYFMPVVALGLQNSRFPDGLQFIHFAALLATGLVFVGGYFSRWRHTPWATVTMYLVLATLCFVETVDFQAFGPGPARFVPMAIEYVMYVLLSTYLLRSAVLRRHFDG